MAFSFLTPAFRHIPRLGLFLFLGNSIATRLALVHSRTTPDL